ncbi:hypothetical protein SLEP1_g47235 [Rubroshorea leprosula]|uniref:Uncharacterized protein n=1 Tax=Rubroshorea leprosula TaxID=152421 RepID=A0AAV5LSK7_9ROSI|nr:hypothetical protein SLEP1_g47235 [Rubroshorea leprosula]
MAADGFVAAANRSSGSKADGSGPAAGQRQQSRWIRSGSRPAAAKQMDSVRQ